jgi:hypothetical protein
MNRIYASLAGSLLLAGAAAAQEDHFVVMAPQVRVMSLQSGVMGKPIKGAPYSAVEVNETNHTLADGTRIHNENQTQVFRDSEGRMRRETPTEVTIWDPVANTSFVLNPKTQTARKLPMGTYFFTNTVRPAGGGSESVAFSYRVGTNETNHAAATEAEMKAVEAKLKAEIETKVRASGGYAVGGGVSTAAAGPALVQSSVVRKMVSEQGKTESLGKRMIEGVNSDGTKTVFTTEVGAIGNDRPIQATTERWFSPELQTVVLSRRSDPRTGEELFKLINVSRAEPPAILFQVPAGYSIVDQK